MSNFQNTNLSLFLYLFYLKILGRRINLQDQCSIFNLEDLKIGFNKMKHIIYKNKKPKDQKNGIKIKIILLLLMKKKGMMKILINTK